MHLFNNDTNIYKFYFKFEIVQLGTLHINKWNMV